MSFFFVATSMRMVSFLRVLTDFGVIIEEIVFSIIKGYYIRRISSVDPRTINLKYGTSWSESNL